MHLPLLDHVTPFFAGHRKCLVKVLLLFTHAVIQCRSCSLIKCAERLPGKLDSQYKRLQRFIRLSNPERFALSVSLMILALLPKQAPAYLVIDRSNWKLGRCNINVLYLGLLISQDCFIPVLWLPVDKRGNSNQDERLDLLARFAQLWPDTEHRLIVLADREFIGRRWIKYLYDNDFGLVIRLRRDDYLHEVAEALDVTWSGIWWHLTAQVRTRKSCVVNINLGGCRLYFIAVEDQKNKGHYTSFVTHESAPEAMQQHYRLRWQIEVFFRHVKRNGFNLEDLNITQLDRLRVVLAVVSLAYTLVVRQGLEEERRSTVTIKRDRATGKTWKARSVFRHGYAAMLKRARSVTKLLRRLVQWLKEQKRRVRTVEVTTTYANNLLKTVL